MEPKLKGVTLHRRNYFLWSDDWDHDHCEFCSVTFGVAGDLTINGEFRTEGWTTRGEYDWVCDRCFGEHAHRFKWKIRTRRATDRPDTPPPNKAVDYKGRVITKARRSPTNVGRQQRRRRKTSLLP
jgi:hypothetical protein